MTDDIEDTITILYNQILNLINMLRKEILGTKIKTQSGLSKPITIAQPKDDSDYKSENFLDTDILLAKDIK